MLQKNSLDDDSHVCISKSFWLQSTLSVTAVVVLILGGRGTLQLWQANWGGKAETEAILALGILDHVHCVLNSRIAEEVYTPERMALAMGPEYVGLVSLLEKMLSRDFQVPVAHQCIVGRRHFVHLIIRNQDKVLSLIVTRKNGNSFPLGGKANGADLLGMPLYLAHLVNLEVAGFETRDHFGFVVSGLDRKTNLQLASDLAPPLRDFLRKIE